LNGTPPPGPVNRRAQRILQVRMGELEAQPKQLRRHHPPTARHDLGHLAVEVLEAGGVEQRLVELAPLKLGQL
jgi:hypothetical protein